MYSVFSWYLCDGWVESPLMQHDILLSYKQWTWLYENCCCNTMLMWYLYRYCVTAPSFEMIKYPVHKWCVTFHHSLTVYTSVATSALYGSNSISHGAFWFVFFYYYSKKTICRLLVLKIIVSCSSKAHLKTVFTQHMWTSKFLSIGETSE